MTVDHYEISAERSTVLISARSSVGPIVFEARQLSGTIDATVVGSVVADDPGPTARLDIDLGSLRSGNDLYDAELRRRIDARRFPRCTIDLDHTERRSPDRFSLRGSLGFHGTVRSMTGTVEVTVPAPGRLVIIGDKSIDIRDFDLPAPSILMLKIYPEVQVQIFLEARIAASAETTTTTKNTTKGAP